jgi:hypothetical protein
MIGAPGMYKNGMANQAAGSTQLSDRYAAKPVLMRPSRSTM